MATILGFHWWIHSLTHTGYIHWYQPNNMKQQKQLLLCENCLGTYFFVNLLLHVKLVQSSYWLYHHWYVYIQPLMFHAGMLDQCSSVHSCQPNNTKQNQNCCCVRIICCALLLLVNFYMYKWYNYVGISQDGPFLAYVHVMFYLFLLTK